MNSLKSKGPKKLLRINMQNDVWGNTSINFEGFVELELYVYGV